MSEIETAKQVARRTVLKGAAWSVPVVAAAAAMPLASASAPNPGCGCLTLGSLGAFTAQSVTALNLGAVAGTIVFNLNSAGCDTGFFKPAYTILGVGGSISFSDGTTSNFTLGVTTGAGTIGQISAFTSPFTVVGGISMPDSNFIGFPPLPDPNYTKKVPTRLCFTFTAIFVPILPIPQIECTYQLCYDITNPSSLGIVLAGTGTVNWSDLTPSNGVLAPA